MKNCVRPLLALALGLVLGLGAYANASDHGYGNDSYATQIGFDSFNQSVKKRLASARIGGATQLFGTAPVLAAPDAYAAPSSRSATVGTSRRQLDCVYYSGFTVWADMYQTWARQRTHGNHDGYSYRTTGPALGFDYSVNGWTFGLATTYAWGRMKGRETAHRRSTRQWALEGYAQYDTERFYANASIAYTYNRFRSQRSYDGGARDRYHTNAWNVDGEFGLKFNFSNFLVTPNVGIRYFRDRHGSINETGTHMLVNANRKNYHVLELPVGINLAYEITTARAIFVPRARVAWIPELARRRGNSEGFYSATGGANIGFSENGAKRGRNGFQFGLGLEAKLTNTLSMHLDYDLKIRSRQREHYWNLGAGFSF